MIPYTDRSDLSLWTLQSSVPTAANETFKVVQRPTITRSDTCHNVKWVRPYVCRPEQRALSLIWPACYVRRAAELNPSLSPVRVRAVRASAVATDRQTPWRWARGRRQFRRESYGIGRSAGDGHRTNKVVSNNAIGNGAVNHIAARLRTIQQSSARWRMGDLNARVHWCLMPRTC